MATQGKTGGGQDGLGPGTGRPSRPSAKQARLSRQRILEVGLRIVDREGIPALTMRRLASELGVNPMSIYHHLPGKAAVLSGLVREVFSRMHVTAPAAGTSWQDQIKHAAHAYRRVLREHPNLVIQVVSNTAAASDALVVAGEPFFEAMEQAGPAPRAVVEAVYTVVDFVNGFVLSESLILAGTFDLGPELLARVRALPRETAPNLTRVAEALGEDGLRYEFESGFEAGLDILVKGIQARHQDSRTT